MNKLKPKKSEKKEEIIHSENEWGIEIVADDTIQ